MHLSESECSGGERTIPHQDLCPRAYHSIDTATCFYHAGMDWLYYLSTRVPYITDRTANAHLCLLKALRTGEQVGFIICQFSQLPRHNRYKLLEHTGMSREDVWGLEQLQQLDPIVRSCIHTLSESTTLEQMCS